MTTLAPTMEAFFSERLISQKQVSDHTLGAYADTFRLLLRFIGDRSGKSPSALDFTDVDAPAIGAFLDDLEHTPGKWYTDPKRPAGSDTFALQLCRIASSRACWPDPASTYNPNQTLQ